MCVTFEAYYSIVRHVHTVYTYVWSIPLLRMYIHSLHTSLYHSKKLILQQDIVKSFYTFQLVKEGSLFSVIDVHGNLKSKGTLMFVPF